MRTLAFFICCSVSLADLQSATDDGHCDKHLLFPAPVGDKPGRKYARDRRIDIHHLKLDVTPDFARRTISGTATLIFAPIARPLARLELDAVDLTVETVQAGGTEISDREQTDEKLILTFTPPIVAGKITTLAVRYRAQPERGLYFRTPEMGYKPGDTQVWSQGEAELHRFWFPCYDYPNERFSSEVICHVPDGMDVISNGRLLSQEKDAAGLNAWHWRQDKPHVNYLVALAAGHFHKIVDKAGDLPLALYVPPSDKNEAPNAFLDTKAILEFFQQEIQVPFPWDKYDQVYCLDFVAGGMENTSCTFLAESLLFSKEHEQLYTLHRLDAHETAHQWFGDLVTCRDWSHLWLNEGFASYYTVLYEEKKNGRDGMLFSLWREAGRVLEAVGKGDAKPIVWRDYTDPMGQFDYRAYPKAAWVLHMLRSQLGPDLYRQSIKTYLERHRGGIVTTDDLQDVFEESSGLSFDRFFDQWVYHGGLPDLAVSYSWDADAKSAKLSVKQSQKVSEQVPLFSFPLPVSFNLPEGKPAASFTMMVSKAEEDFHFALPAQPELVRLDPEFTVLAKVSFTPSPEMLKRQLGADLIGRLLAVQALAEKKDHDSVGLLGKAVSEDGFWGVRIEAIKALRKINNAEARKALLAAAAQPDARVRRELVEALGAFFHEETREALNRLRAAEQNPDVLAAILSASAPAPWFDPSEFLGRPSYRQRVARSAVAALRAQDAQARAPQVMKRLQESALDFDTDDYAAGLDALAFLARRQENKDEVRGFLGAHLSHPREAYRRAAAKALGTLNDVRALALLQPLTATRKPFKDPVREAAEKSIQQIESLQVGPPEIQNIWQRFQELQKRTEELETQLEKLQKKARPEKPAEVKAAG
ncbi:MAG: M1 family aminopeptidase [Verrucomicrobiales bacterium]